MRRVLLLPSVLVIALGAALSSTSCATYRQDLARARVHYQHDEFEASLALLRVLEPDMDSLSTAEQAQYAYARGMTDFRMASLTTQSSGFKDPKQAFRSHARHWLGLARAIDKASPGGLTGDEKQRLEAAMTDLDRDVFGGVEGADAGAPVGDGGASVAETAPGRASSKEKK